MIRHQRLMKSTKKRNLQTFPNITENKLVMRVQMFNNKRHNKTAHVNAKRQIKATTLPLRNHTTLRYIPHRPPIKPYWSSPTNPNANPMTDGVKGEMRLCCIAQPVDVHNYKGNPAKLLHGLIYEPVGKPLLQHLRQAPRKLTQSKQDSPFIRKNINNATIPVL